MGFKVQLARNLLAEWFAEVVPMVHEAGYRVTPVYSSGATQPYSDEQTYPDLSDPCWRDAEMVGVVLDDALLLDYDGNKASETSPVISLDDLTSELDLPELPEPVQRNKEGDSLHFLFSWPRKLNEGEYKQANNGGWLPHVDLKRGNQLVNLKPHKLLPAGRLPAKDQLPEAPQKLLQALYSGPISADATSHNPSTWKGTGGEVDEAHEILTYIPIEDEYDPWLDVLMRIHDKFGSTPEAVEIADKWSQQSEHYDRAEIEAKLESFSSVEDGRQRKSWRALCVRARKNGADLAEISRKYLAEFAPTSVVAGAGDPLVRANEEYAVVTAGDSVVILREVTNAETHPDIQLLSQSGFMLLTKNWPGVNGTSFANHWLQHPRRRQYDGLVFDPSGRASPSYYNLYRGFATTPGSGSCRLYLRFVCDVICAGDAELGAYVINWMAHLIQRPYEMAEVALVLRSGQGTGKNTFVMPLARILGQMFYECTNMERLTGNFNGHLKDKLLVHANEATWGGNKSAEGTLKAMITDPFRAVEHKHKDVITVRNYTRLVISSNEEWPVASGPDDRRFVFLDVSEAHKQDHDYFKALLHELDNGGVEALHDHLLKIDIDGWHPRQRPKPRYGADVKIRSLDLVGQWLYEVFESGVIASGDPYAPFPQYPWGTEPNVPNNMIVASVDTFARKQLRRERVPDRGTLFKRLHKLCPGITKTRPKDRCGHGARSHCCVFPHLDECRRSFEKAINCEGLIDWSEVEDDDN